MSPISVCVCTHACLHAVFIWYVCVRVCVCVCVCVCMCVCVCVCMCELNTEHCYIATVQLNEYSYAVLIIVQLLVI